MDTQSRTARLVDLTVTQFADALAGDQPAPGGGSASALAGVLGAALATMVAGLTLGREKYAAHQEEMMGVRTRAEELKTALLALVDADTEAFRRVTATYRLPGDTESQRTERTAAIQATLKAATDVPLATAVACAEVLELAGQVAARGNRNASSDAAVAALMAHAGLCSAARSVRSNLTHLTDDTFRIFASRRVADLLETGGAALECALRAANPEE